MPDANTFEEAIDAVRGEMEYQEALWGPTETGGEHSITEFLVYIRSYTNEALETMSRKGEATAVPPTLDTMRKIATLAIKTMVAHGVWARNPTAKECKHALAKRRVEGK